MAQTLHRKSELLFERSVISLDYLESSAVRSKERGMEMAQFEMNLSVPAVPALAELLNCGPGKPVPNIPLTYARKHGKDRNNS